jgi:F-type H+-transporting ATPase subunit gamma
MSRAGKLERHRRSLAEIREIMSSMKSLAYMETRKLGQKGIAQRRLVEGIESAAEDLLYFYPSILPSAAPAAEVRIVVGTERGFCGDLNASLARHISAEPDSPSAATILAIGHKLHTRLEDESSERALVLLDGANVLEEVPAVLERIVSELESIRSLHGALDVRAVYYRDETEIAERKLLPPFDVPEQAPPKLTHPPSLNLRPADLLVELTDHYLLASLHEVLYASLLNENQQRVTHLGLSVKHLDGKLADIRHRGNALRQEEITEEIEVILLSSADLMEPDPIG